MESMGWVDMKLRRKQGLIMGISVFVVLVIAFCMQYPDVSEGGEDAVAAQAKMAPFNPPREDIYEK